MKTLAIICVLAPSLAFSSYPDSIQGHWTGKTKEIFKDGRSKSGTVEYIFSPTGSKMLLDGKEVFRTKIVSEKNGFFTEKDTTKDYWVDVACLVPNQCTFLSRDKKGIRFYQTMLMQEGKATIMGGKIGKNGESLSNLEETVTRQ